MSQIILCGGISLVPYIRPVGIYQLANVLRRNGYSVQVIDSFPWIAHIGIDEVLKLFDKFVTKETLWIGFGTTWFNKISDLVKRHPGDIKAGTMKNNKEEFIKNTLLFDKDEIEILKSHIYKKNPNVKFVMGGARAFIGRGGWCAPLIDCYIEGYADTTVLEYTKFLEGKNPFLLTRKNPDGSISLTHDHKATTFDYNNFKFTWDDSDLINPKEMLPMEIARGCIFSCAFCAYPLNGRKKMDYLKNPNILREQFIENYDRFGTTDYFFLDDTFNDSVEKLEILHTEVFKKLPFKINFGAYMRLDLINAHRKTIQMLKDMGIAGAMFGIESLNYESNKAVGKGMTMEKVLEIGKILAEEWGDEVSIDSQYIIGLPNDGEKEIKEWLDVVLSADFPIRASQIFPLHLDKEKTKKNIWTSKFDLDPEKYGYTFPKKENSTWWINNKGLTFDDAIRIREEFNEKWQRAAKPLYLGKHGRRIIGTDVTKNKKWRYAQMWSTEGDFESRIDFTKNYIERLLAL
jgi:radical SAM superfamily enzyme YgiQ (UPF0313 family)